MPENGNNTSRRSVLKKIGVATAGFTATGPAVASASKGNKDRKPGNEEENYSSGESRSIKLSPENAMSKSEFENYKSQMADKYGSETVQGIEPTTLTDSGGQVGTQQVADNTQNLTYENAWNTSFEIYDGPVYLGSTDHSLVAYSDQASDAGQNHYFFWQWSMADAHDPLAYTSNTETLRNEVNFLDGNINLEEFEPANVLTVEGEVYTLTVGVDVGPFIASLSGDLFHSGGQIGPSNVNVGSAGQYTVEFTGCQTNKTTINGAVRASSYYDFLTYSSDVEWNTYAFMGTGVCYI